MRCSELKKQIKLNSEVLSLSCRRIMADQDVSFMKFGVMLTPVTEGDESWGPRKDRGEDAPSKDNGHENETFEEEKA